MNRCIVATRVAILLTLALSCGCRSEVSQSSGSSGTSNATTSASAAAPKGPSKSDADSGAAQEIPEASGSDVVGLSSSPAEAESSEDASAGGVEAAGSADATGEESSGVAMADASAVSSAMKMKGTEGTGELGAAADDEAPSSEELAAEEVDPVPASESYRFLAPTTAGPLLIEVSVQIGEQRMSQAFKAHVDTMVALIDADDSGSMSLDELVECDAAWGARFGRPRPNDGQRKNTAKGYDSDRDKFVSRDELLRFLARDGGTSRPFDLRSSSYYRGQNGLRGTVAQSLDVNQDRSIDESEMLAAAERLLLLDRSGDQVVSATELREIGLTQDPAWNNRGRGIRNDTATLLTNFKQWSMLSYTLAGEWSRARQQDNAWVDAWFQELDTDGDGELDRTESEGLSFATPHLSVLLSFDSDHAATSDPPTVRLSSSSEGIDARVVNDGGDTLQIQIGDALRLSLTVRDNPPAFLQQAREILRVLDANKNDALDEDEAPPQLVAQYGSFEEADANGDGKLVLEELVTLGQTSTPLWYFQIRSRAGEQADALFEWLDANGDNRLVTREIRNASSRLTKLDANGDSKIDAKEYPEAYRVEFFRGQPQQDDMLGSLARAVVPDDSIPAWASAMDVNKDQDISTEEFLGTRDQFQSLDDNDDGFIDVAEAAAYRSES